MAKKSKNNRKKSNQLLIAFWVLIFVLLIVVFFARRNQIKQNLNDTDFFGRIFGKTPAFMQDTKEKENETDASKLNLLGATSGKEKYSEVTGTEANKVSPSEVSKTSQGANQSNNTANKSSSDSENIANSNDKETVAKDGTKQDSSKAKDSKTETQSNANAKTDSKTESKKEETAAVVVPKKTEITLYFVSIDSDGSVSRKSAKRTLEKSDSPLTDSINALLRGPSPDESGKDCMTLIPAGTKLLGASVKNGVATLNFNENFEFNSFGVEGYIAQLMQVVFTATEFSTVRSVQFLIEGEKKDYLGSEGQWIGSPLARSSF